MEFLYGNFEACPQDLVTPPNEGFKDIECPVDPETELPWFKQ